MADGPAEELVLEQNNLFHPFTRSPLPAIRRRAAYMMQNVYCPHPSHKQSRQPAGPTDLEARKSATEGAPPARVRFECPDCGIPVYCCEAHWADDFEQHIQLCETLRQANEDDHDLRSGRHFAEFEYPGPMIEEALPNLSNWDTFLYTRQFRAIDDMRQLRQATSLLTYPITIASVVHELSPYSLKSGNQLTPEGLRSFSALRFNLHPPKRGEGPESFVEAAPPVRIFVIGARAESSLPRSVWEQLTHLFTHRLRMHLILIGPESMLNRGDELPLPERSVRNPFGAVVEDRISHQMKISTYVEYYHTLHRAQEFQPFDPYFDCFVLFHPGLGHPASSHEWEDTIPQLLETKVPIIVTGYTRSDMERDIKWVKDRMAGEIDILLEPGENRF